MLKVTELQPSVVSGVGVELEPTVLFSPLIQVCHQLLCSNYQVDLDLDDLHSLFSPAAFRFVIIMQRRVSELETRETPKSSN